MRTIQKLAKNFSGITAFAGELRNHYGLRAAFSSFNGERVLHVSRSPGVTPILDATDDANPIMLSNDLRIIAAGLPKVHPLSSAQSHVCLDDGMAKVSVEKMYEGTKVIVSKDKGRPIICTKKDPHGCDIIPETSLSAYVVFSYLLDQSYGDMPRLFDKSHHYNELSWEFMIVKKEFMPPDSKMSYELVLIGATHKITTTQLPEIRLDYIADSLGVRRPDREMATSYEEANDIFKRWSLNDQTVRGVVLTDTARNTASILTRRSNRSYGYCKAPARHNQLRILEWIMKGEEQKAISFDPRYKILVNSMRFVFKKAVVELEALQNDYGKARTRRHLASKISKHDLALVLFALHSGKIGSLNDMGKVLKPHYLLKVIEKRDRLRVLGATNLSKGILCQRKL